MKTYVIPYDKPFNYDELFKFMSFRAIKGVEYIQDETYSRTFRLNGVSGYFSVGNDQNLSALILKVAGLEDDTLVAKIRMMFDLDTDFTMINERFSQDPILSRGMMDGHVPRLPMAFDSFEHMLRAILGQQITVKAATTLAGRVVEKVGISTPDHYPTGLDYYFPTYEELLEVDLENIGITTTRVNTIRTVLEALKTGAIHLSQDQTYEQLHSSLIQLKGIGDWTINYLAMRGLRIVDSFPAKDLGVIKALTFHDKKPSHKEIIEMSKKWQPFRAYASLCLWKFESLKSKP
jgi:3-methyladenine DNA glycosylase/8-oxoguanine DNA glycosylase